MVDVAVEGRKAWMREVGRLNEDMPVLLVPFSAVSHAALGQE